MRTSRMNVNYCHQTKNSPPQKNATSCFEFKSGRQDLNRELVIMKYSSLRQIGEIRREFLLP
jgi:hypothetical protein